MDYLFIQISDSGGVEMVWEDGHRSTYPKKWLLARSFSEISRAERKERELEDRPVLWSSKDMQGKLPKHQFGYSKTSDSPSHSLTWFYWRIAL